MIGLGQIRGVGMGALSSGPVDPEFANVSFLFYGDGASGANTFVDLSANNAPSARTGTPTQATDPNAFLGTALRYNQVGPPGSYVTWTKAGGYLTQRQSTIEFQINMQENTTGSSGNNFNTIIGLQEAGGTLIRVIGRSGGSVDVFGVSFAAPAAIGTNRWVAVVHHDVAGVLRRYVYINGVRVSDTGPVTYPFVNANNRIIVGCINGVINSPLYAHGAFISQVRVTEGVARYTGASYTLPTAPFPRN